MPNNILPMVSELIQCFVPPPAAMIEKMNSVALSIPESARDDVLQSIIETEGPSSKIGVKQIIEACERIGVSYRKAHFVPAEAWICDACGHEFKYAIAPSDDDRIDKELHDFCPMCGFQPGWTKLMEHYRGQGIATDWYDRLLADCQDFGPGKPEIKVKKGGMTLTRGGIFWSRAKAEQERRDEKRVNVEAKIAEIDRMKRWRPVKSTTELAG